MECAWEQPDLSSNRRNGIVSGSFACIRDPFPLTGLLHLKVRRGAQSSCNLICLVWLLSLGSLPFSEGKGGEGVSLGKTDRRWAGRGTGREEGGETEIRI